MRQENKTLWQEWYFHFALFLPLAIGVALAARLWMSGYGLSSMCLEVACYSEFANAFELPIAVIAAAIPLTILAGATHRSAQTKRQIDVQMDQNIFSNYYKHLEEFERFCRLKNPKPEPPPPQTSKTPLEVMMIRSIQTRGHRDFDYRALHGKLYPHARRGIFDLDVDLYDDACNFMASLVTAEAQFPDNTVYGDKEELALLSSSEALSRIDDNDVTVALNVIAAAASIWDVLREDDMLAAADDPVQLVRMIRSDTEHFERFLSFDTSQHANQIRHVYRNAQRLCESLASSKSFAIWKRVGMRESLRLLGEQEYS